MVLFGHHDSSLGVEFLEELFDHPRAPFALGVTLSALHRGNLRNQYDAGELNLIKEQLHDRSIVFGSVFALLLVSGHPGGVVLVG